jgi:phosphatidylglycerol:prolipoprotein diacylglycerol transferase
VFPEIHLGSLGSIPTYLLYLSLLYTGLVFYTVSRAHAREKDPKTALELALLLMLGGFLGGRLFHVFYESPEFYMKQPKYILYFWNGGFVFYGGFIGSILLAGAYTWIKKLSFLEWGDFFAPIIAVGYGLGRGSCFLAGCCYGKFCSLPWAVSFDWDPQKLPRHPTQLYAVFWELMVFCLLIFLERRQKANIFYIWLLLHSIGRMIMEHYRDDFRGADYAGLSISSWISLLLFSTAVAGLSYKHFAANKRFNKV